MSDDLKIVTVPRDLYYHEIAYVRGLEADNARLRAALRLMDEFAWTAVTADCEEARIGLNERLAAARAALEPKP